MNRFLLIAISCLMLCSCGNRAAKKAEQEAQKAQIEYQQSVIDLLKTRVHIADSLLTIFKANKQPGMLAPEVLDEDFVDALMLYSDDPKTFNERSDEIRESLDKTIEFLRYATAGQK